MAVVPEPSIIESTTSTSETHEDSSQFPSHETERTQSFSYNDPYDFMLPKNDPFFLAPIRKFEKKLGFQTPLKWTNLISISVLHILTAAWTAYYLFTWSLPKWQTLIFVYAVVMVGAFGVTAGAHRLWCHRAYKANLPLRVLLSICCTIAGQNDIFEWVRDHRVHHKYSGTSRDPHDASRGFFFAHVGWLMMKKHPDVMKAGQKVDMSDVVKDPVVQFQKRYFTPLKIMLCFVLPTIVPPLCWNEGWLCSFYSICLFRYLYTLNGTWTVNSLAHLYGYKPYDSTIMPVENAVVSFITNGEGWHNYHHTFPWDYKAAELPYYFNGTTLGIDLFNKIGWAYDLRVASPNMIKSVAENKGEKLK